MAMPAWFGNLKKTSTNINNIKNAPQYSRALNKYKLLY